MKLKFKDIPNFFSVLFCLLLDSGWLWLIGTNAEEGWIDGRSHKQQKRFTITTNECRDSNAKQTDNLFSDLETTEKMVRDIFFIYIYYYKKK